MSDVEYTVEWITVSLADFVALVTETDDLRKRVAILELQCKEQRREIDRLERRGEMV